MSAAKGQYLTGSQWIERLRVKHKITREAANRMFLDMVVQKQFERLMRGVWGIKYRLRQETIDKPEASR